MVLKHTLLACIAPIAFIHLPGVESQSPYIISDDRVRNLDLTPVLGRGYSIMTDTFHSTCLIADVSNHPSYNYDFFYIDFTKETDNSNSMSMSALGGGTIMGVQIAMEASASSSSKVKTKTQTIISTMRIERYYNSVREEFSPLSDDSLTLLERQDYVGFFKACGPNYIRSIRRVQELTAIFKFSSSDRTTAMSFSASLEVSVMGNGIKNKNTASSKFRSLNTSMTITILGYGMGLNQEGSGTLVATSLEDFNGVMKFSFNAMTKNEDSNNVGMVYGMEVVPWVNNAAFQVAAKLGDENIIIPLPRSMIPMAVRPNSNAAFTEATRVHFQCKNELLLKIDKFGYCCEPSQLYDPIREIYPEPEEDAVLQSCVCRPVYNLEKTLIKDNMSNNGEFVARLDSALRYKIVQLAQLEKCITAVHAIPVTHQWFILKKVDTVYDPNAVAIDVTGAQLKKGIDPLGDYSMITHLGREMDEWIEMYYSPCLAALFGTNVGRTPGVETSFFMAYPWHTHRECMKLLCLVNNMRWNRESGGCVTSLVSGIGAADYDGDDDYCAQDVTEYGDREVCKWSTTILKDYFDKVQLCWRSTNAQIGIDFLINNYCLPELTPVNSTEPVANALSATFTDCPQTFPAVVAVS